MATIRSLATEFGMQPHELVAYTALDQLAETDELNEQTETFIPGPRRPQHQRCLPRRRRGRAHRLHVLDDVPQRMSAALHPLTSSPYHCTTKEPEMTEHRQVCRKCLRSTIPAETLTFDNGTRRLHWCSEHVDDAEQYRDSADRERA